jgi:hypothetical protein
MVLWSLSDEILWPHSVEVSIQNVKATCTMTNFLKLQYLLIVAEMQSFQLLIECFI